MTAFSEGFLAPSHPLATPKRLIFNRVNITGTYKLQGLDNVTHKQFSLENVSENFVVCKFREIAWIGTVYDFLIDYEVLDVKNILHIQEY